MHGGIQPISLSVQRAQADQDDPEAKENEGQIIAQIDPQSEVMDRVPTQQSASVKKDAVDLQGESVESVAEITGVEKNVREEGDHHQVMEQDGQDRRRPVQETVEEITEKVADAECDHGVVEVIRVRERVGEDLRGTEEGEDQQQ